MWEREDVGGHMDCNFRAEQQEVSMELFSSVLFWHVLMANETANSSTITQEQASPAANGTLAIN